MRGFALPEGASGEGITASYRDGVLEVVVPKALERGPAMGEAARPAAAGRGLGG